MGTENQRGNEVMKPSELKIKLRWAKNLRICGEERNGSSYLQGRRRDDAEVRGWTMWKVVMSYLWTKIKHKEELDDFSGGSKFLLSNLDCSKISPVNFFFADIGSFRTSHTRRFARYSMFVHHNNAGQQNKHQQYYQIITGLFFIL